MKADVDHKGDWPARASADRGGRPAFGPGASILGSRLFIKYVALFVSVVVLALVANGAFEVWFSFQEQKAALTKIQHQEAVAAADKIEEFVTQIQSQLGWTTQLPWTNGTLDQRRFDALRLLRQVPAITELAQIDASGHEQLKVSRLTMDVVGSGIDYSDKPEFKEAVKNKVYYGPVYFRRESEPYMTIALAGARIENGVSIAQVNLKLIWDVVSGIKVGENGHAYVVDGDGRLIAHPDISLVLRNTDMSKLAQVQSARAGGSGEDVQEADEVGGHKVLTAYARVRPLGWYVFVETPIEEAYAPLYRSVQRSGYVLFGALALAFIAGAFLARRMVVPIQALRTGAARIGSGDLAQRIDIKTGDEVEALANQFNAMAGQLQESYADLEKKVEDRTADLTEALQQQTATSEVLRVISASPGELEPVFRAILANATRICEAKFGVMHLYKDGQFKCAAEMGAPPAFAEFLHTVGWHRPEAGSPLERVLQTKRTGRIVRDADEKTEGLPAPPLRFAGARTLVAVPMLKEAELIGVIVIYRQEVRPFTEKQIALVENFAAQAVIAIENTRLLSELRESLEQQTATADVLRVISSSPGELEPVFSTMLENAARICEAKFGTMLLAEGDKFRIAAQHGAPPAWAEKRSREPLFAPGPSNNIARAARSGKPQHVYDLRLDRSYIEREPAAVALADIAGARTLLVVPMLKDDVIVGVIGIYRQEVRPFTDKQIALVTNFAAQAVIAIENTRLLSELRESLEQQTATSDVLRVISSSPGDLEPVFRAMLENATRLCDASFGSLALREGDGFTRVALHNAPPAFLEFNNASPHFGADISPSVGMLARTKEVVHATDFGTTESENPLAKYAGARTLLMAPLLKDGELRGVFGIYRQEARPFTEKQIGLLTNFAAQAVIAIENARLLSELRQSLEQQTATADVLRVISSSPGELQPVFEAVLENATRLCEAKFGSVFLRTEDGFRNMLTHGAETAHVERWKQEPVLVLSKFPDSPLAQVARTKAVVHVSDLGATAAYQERRPTMVRLVEVAGARTMLSVPMLKDNEVVGAIGIYRKEVSPFTDKQIELLENFAAQAVIAIENTRLLSELRQRTDDLTYSLNELRTAQDRLVQTEKLASLGQLTAGIAHEIKNPLNFVNNFAALSAEMMDELQEELAKVQVDEAARAEINDLADTLKGNLEKITQHGKRADSIVKNMLLHSREGSGEHRPVDVNALVEESLNLAYHGARAEKQGFNITLERSFDPAAGQADLYPQEVTRVLLNLISNGFYAAHKRKAQVDGEDFEPTLAAATRNLGDRVEIRIRDNGTGIPPEVKERMFNPFFTTKPAGEGTGLGLSISHDIIVKQHAGTIVVDTEPGKFTEFTIVLPRKAAALEKTGGRA